MFLTIMATVLSAVLLLIFSIVYSEIAKQNNQNGKSITMFIIVSQIIILVEVLLSYFNVI